jgi:hypothetical protein
MKKLELLKLFEIQITNAQNLLTQAALVAHQAATHAESKAEDKYDTRGLEASYLAGAQSKRAMELDELFALYKYADLKAFGPTTPIASTALIQLESENKRSFYLMMPKGGGMAVEFHGRTVQAITPQAPMGRALLGRCVGDEVRVDIQGKFRDYLIVSVE